MIETPLVKMTLDEITSGWQPGSEPDQRWYQEVEYVNNDEKTPAIRQRIAEEGYGFADDTDPITLGNDGRVWDGHHRIVLALTSGQETLMVRVAPADDEKETTS